MEKTSLDIVILGLTITSSWGNGHATTFRGLVRELHRNGHRVTFLERDMHWYAENRDLPSPPYCRTVLYDSLEELKDHYAEVIERADLVIVGSYVQEGVEAGNFVQEVASGITAFYDIDTPVTLSMLERKNYEYLHPRLIPRYDMYLSFTGGPALQLIEDLYGSPMARPFYCSFDPELYYPENYQPSWDLGYLGTYSADRQPPLETLMLDAARLYPEGKFVVAGPQYPPTLQWPGNVERIEHVPPSAHRKFYNSQRFTMNITRADMVKAGFSPSVRLFEAAACGTPVISDEWEGLDSFFDYGTEILISRSAGDTLGYLHDLPEKDRIQIGVNARQKVLSLHTAANRAKELENYYNEAKCQTPVARGFMENLRKQ